jgi:hypothetical protein
MRTVKRSAVLDTLRADVTQGEYDLKEEKMNGKRDRKRKRFSHVDAYRQ